MTAHRVEVRKRATEAFWFFLGAGLFAFLILAGLALASWAGVAIR